jgi:hypothetical protein
LRGLVAVHWRRLEQPALRGDSGLSLGR